MISIDVTSLNDLAEVEKAIEKLSFVRDALKKAEDARTWTLREAWSHFYGPADAAIKARDLYRRDDLAEYASKLVADNARGIGLTPHQEKVATRFEDLTPEDLDEMNAGPVAWPKLVPVMDPQDAIQDDGIVCLIDGEKRKFLGRYVRTVHHMSWDSYLERFDLPADYPEVCNDLLEQRRKAAVERGFGKRDRDQEPEQQVQVTVPIRRAFGRLAAPPQVSVKVDIGGSKNTTAERRKERRLGGLM